MNDWRDTAATRLFGVDLPLFLGPFGGMSSVELAGAVSNAGGLGSFGLYGYDGSRILETARALRSATDGPFALNLWLPLGGDQLVRPTNDEFEEYIEALRPYFDELGVEAPTVSPERYLPTFDEQFDAVLEARPAVVSFVFGAPPLEVVSRAHDAGILVVAAATTVDEAVAIDAMGVEAIVATGMEAGGHRVSFLRAAEDSLVGTMALVPQVVDAVHVPVIAAGGIADGRGVSAAMMLGASAVQIGSAFLATEQSAAAPAYREVLREGSGQTVLTRALSGRLARGIPNRLTREIEFVAPFPVQNWLTGRFRPTAGERGITDLMSLWAGQASPLISERDATALVARLVADATALLSP